MKKISYFIIAILFGGVMIISSCATDSYSDSPIELRGGGNGNGGNGNGNGGNGNGNGNGGGNASQTDLCACIEANYPNEELSDVEVAALLKMREEEKLARDVYIAMYEKWNQNVFNNISKSEQRHMDAILCLINKYGLEDPVGDNGIGEFEDSGLQDLYNSLVDLGNQSLISALTVGATIEDLDIYDLIELSGEIDNQDILAVFNDLTKGSRNHMRSFYRQLENLGGSYTPQFISQELFDSIINSNMERGGSICNDSNSGNGNGNRGKKGRRGHRRGGRGHGHRH